MASPLDSRLDLLFQLVDRLLAESKLSTAQRNACQDNLCSYAARVLGSQLAQSTLVDDQTVMQGLAQDLEAQGRPDKMTRVWECYDKLSRNPSMSSSTRSGVLHLLRQAARDKVQPAVKPGAPNLTAQRLGGGGLQSLLPSRADTAAARQQQQQQQQQQDPLGAHGKGKREVTSSPDDPSLFSVKEPLLVRDVLYACQGINGKYTSYQAAAPAWHAAASGPDSTTRFVINPQAEVPPAERELMNSLMELGFLFKRVQSHVSAPQEGGAVRQALCSALNQECKDFYRFMAVLQSQAAERIPAPGDHSDAAPGPYLTIRRLAVWLSEPIRRMRLLATLADATDGLSGGSLAGAVYSHVHAHGDPFVRSYTSRVLSAVCVPLFEMIRQWVFQGQIEDPHGEFFVVRLGAAASGEGGEGHGDMWREGYGIEGSRLPEFLSQQLAHKILRAGKSINFLQECCGDVAWVQERAMAAHAAAAAAVSIGQIESLERFVQSASALVDRRLIDIVFNKFQLAKHCDALRRYVLLGQGDFVQALMDMAQNDLNQEASAVSEISLNHAVRQAISASNAKYDDDDVIDRVRARKNKAAGAGEVGWDVFRLHYELRGPLATLFTPSAMSEYLRVFQLLWRLKRAETCLSQSWMVLKCEVERTAAKFNRGSKGGADLALAVTRKFLKLCSEMSHFCTNFQYYIMFEVMESAWQEFNQQAAAASDLDQLIAVHDTYRCTLLRKALLDDASEGLRGALKDLLENMLTLRGQVRKFSDTVRGAYAKLHQSKLRIQQRTAKGQWGTAGGDDDIREVPPADLEPLSRGIDELDRRHKKGIADFTQKLPSQAHEEVRFLLYRLDFTEFYKRSTPAEEEGDSGEEGEEGDGDGASAQRDEGVDGMMLD